MKVEQFHAKNQFVLTLPDGSRAFQSYNTIIAVISPSGAVTLNKKWDHSNTTGKYRNLFLGDSGKKETAKKIRSGEYKLADLNK